MPANRQSRHVPDRARARQELGHRVKPGETEFLHLTTTGRRTGQPRQIEIWFTERAGRYYVIAEHLWERHWVQNVLADPRVWLRVAHEEIEARARVIEPTTEPDLHQTVQPCRICPRTHTAGATASWLN
jgi:deazaflavin-dependent oxidoreductase (nitroreductase family)